MYSYVQLATGEWYWLVTSEYYNRAKNHVELQLEHYNDTGAEEHPAKEWLKIGLAVYIDQKGRYRLPNPNDEILASILDTTHPHNGKGLTGFLTSKGEFFYCKHKGHAELISQNPHLKEDKGIIHMSVDPYSDSSTLCQEGAKWEEKTKLTEEQEEWFEKHKKYLDYWQIRCLDTLGYDTENE